MNILFYHLHLLQNFAQYLRVDARVIVIAITNVKSFILVSICYSFGKIYSKQDFDFLLLFDVKMYYYCEIIMYNIFCSIKKSAPHKLYCISRPEVCTTKKYMYFSMKQVIFISCRTLYYVFVT